LKLDNGAGCLHTEAQMTAAVRMRMASPDTGDVALRGLFILTVISILPH